MTQRMKAIDLDGRYLPAGEVIADRFKIGEKIGEGPFGQVYQAEDTLIEAKVAIKVFSDNTMSSPLDEENFLKATRRARALTQKNVVRLHDSGVHKDHPWVSMQHLEGLNLRKVARLRWQREESFGLQELEPIIAQVTLALQHVGRDFPHGNLKPENIIFLPELLKITDSYVLSALPRAVFAARNQEQPFIAPELQEEGREPDARCDVYSVGAILGFLLFGKEYQPGTEAEAPGAMSAVDVLCKRAMAFDPSERYRSVEELNEDFTAIIDTGSLLNRSKSPDTSPPAPPPGDTSSQESAPAQRAPAKKQQQPVATQTPPDETQPSAPEESVDPLELETSPDIGMPLEDDVATTEYDRDDHSPELGDLLQTNEVDRDQMPPASVSNKKAPTKPSPPPTRDQPAETIEPTRRPERDKEETSPGKEAAPTAKPKSDKKKEDSSGFPVAAMVAAAAVVALFIGVIIIALGDDVDEATTEAVPVEVTEQEDDDEADLEEQRAAERQERERERAEQRLRELDEAVAAASAPLFEAHSAAIDRSEERAEELEEERQEEQAQAAAGAGARPGGASPGAAAAPQPTDCPSQMVRVSVGGEYVCVDAYQYPGRGHTPQVNVSWFDANRLCGQEDKRLCTLQEWQRACGSGYPYGAAFNPDRCNTADADGFDRSLAEAGSFPQCRSPSGAYDMSGNVHEWVNEQRVAGGGYDSGADVASCSYSSAMAPGSDRANVGFRCCAPPS